MSTIGDISYHTKWLLSKRYVQAIIVITLMALAIAIPFLTRAFAVTDLGCTTTPGCVFQLDGTIHKTSSTTFPTNWDAIFNKSGLPSLPLPTGTLDTGFVNDAPLPDPTTFTTGSKDILNLSNNGWQCTSANNLTPKDKILDVYSFAIVPNFGPRAGHVLIYAGYERFSNSGAGDVGIWLFQDPTVACSSLKGTSNFNGTHINNDILLTAEFSTGGSVTTLNAFKWDFASTTNLDNLTSTGANDCTAAPVTANFCARSNSAPLTNIPWPVQDKTSGPNTLATAEFFDVGVDLTGLLGSNAPCINRFLFDSRASPSPTADLHDFAAGSLSTCPKATISTSVSPSTIALGGFATDTATVGLTQSTGTVSGTVTFNVYGPFNSPPTSTSCTTGTLVTPFSPNTVNIGPGTTPQSATSGTFTPTSAGYYAWTATYNPATPRNGNMVSTKCSDTGETLTVVASKISTSVSPTPITLGGSATDTATVMLTPSTATVFGTVNFFVYGPVGTNTPTCTALAASFTRVSIGPATGSASATSGSFTPTAPGYYFWKATYNAAGAANGNNVTSACGAGGETLLVSGIPKITSFSFTNTPTNNDPTLGTGSVTYSFTIHNYGASAVTLSGSLTFSGTASVTCTGGNTLAVSGSLAAFGSSGDSATFNLTCSYSGTSGQTVSATVDAMFAVSGGATHEVSGSPTTYTFTIQKA